MKLPGLTVAQGIRAGGLEILLPPATHLGPKIGRPRWMAHGEWTAAVNQVPGFYSGHRDITDQGFQQCKKGELTQKVWQTGEATTLAPATIRWQIWPHRG